MASASLLVKVALVVAAVQMIVPDSFGQTFVQEPGELERLRAENRELCKRLAEAEQKLKTGKQKAAPAARDQKRNPTATGKEEYFGEGAELSTRGRVRSPESLATFCDRVFLRKSVFSEDVLSPSSIFRPAQFTFEHDGDGRDSYAIDSGLAVTFITTSLAQAQIDWAIGFDYHRHDAETAPRNLLQTGILADSILGNAATSDFFAWLKTNLSYKDDQTKDLKAVAGGLDVLPVARLLWIDNYHKLGPSHWRWQPFVGLRWENSTAVSEPDENGHQVLARYGIEAQIFPLFDYLGRSLELTLNLTAWSNIDSSGVYRTEAWRGYLETNLTYWFSGGLSSRKDKVNLGFGLGYEKGDNPDLNRTDVDLLTLSLKAKF